MSERRGWRDLAAFAAYGGLALIFTYPLVTQLRTHLAGAGDDPWIFYWNNWWVRQVLEEGGSPYWTSYLYFPQGASLVFHSFSWTNTLLALLLEPLAGPVAAYNLTLILGYAFSGWGTYALASYLTGSRGAAFVSGLIFGFLPYRITQASHPLFVTAGWLPLFLLFLIRSVRERRLALAVLAGIFLALTGWTGWHLYIFAWIMALVYVVYAAIWERRDLSGRSWGALAVALLVGLALVMPGLYPLLEVQAGGQADAQIYVPQDERTQTDLLAYVTPNRLHPVFGEAFTQFYDRFQKNRNYVASLGFSVLALAAIGIWAGRREAVLWLLMAGLLAAMALGPILRFNGRLFPHVPMPYQLVGWTPFVRLLKQPDRFNLVVGLPLAVLAGYGVGGLQDRWPARWGDGRRWVVALASGLVVGWELLSIPIWTRQVSIPAYAEALRDSPEESALLELPMGRAADKLYMLHQTVHGRPMVGGHISRPLPGTRDFIESQPLLAQLGLGQPIDLADEQVVQGMAALAEAGVRTVVLHKRRSPAELEANWRARLGQWQAAEDDDVVVFDTAGYTGE